MKLVVGGNSEPQKPYAIKQGSDQTVKPLGAKEVDQATLIDSIKTGEPQATVSLERIKSRSNTGYYGEPPGIDYGKVFAAIGQFFSRVARYIEEGASSIGSYIRIATVLSRRNDEVVKSSEVNFSEDLKNPKSQSLKVATSNVGMDGAFGELNKLLSREENRNPEFAKEYLKSKFDVLRGFQTNLPEGNSESKELNTFCQDFSALLSACQEGSPELTETQKEQLTRLAGFITDLENRKSLKAELGNVSQFDLNRMNEAVLALYHFSKIHSDWTKAGDGSSLTDYVKNKAAGLTAERLSQIVDKDVCFLQELSDESDFAGAIKKNEGVSLFIPKGELGMSHPSLMINKERFEVIGYTPPENARKLKDFHQINMDVPEVENKQPLQIYNDGSFGSGEKFRAVIVIDKNNGKKLLLCSVHIPGYGIGTQDYGHSKAKEDVFAMQKMIEKIAADQGVDGIIMGGDFNSVEEKVADFDSPLEPLKEAKYVQVRVKSDTEVAPTGFYQEGYALSRKIDHIFVKCMSEDDHYVKASKGKVGHGRKGALNPLDQTVFDHEALSAEIEIKKTWLKMLKHRFSYQKPEPRVNVEPQEI